MQMFEHVARIVAASQLFFFASVFFNTFRYGRKTYLISVFYITILAYLLRVYVKDDSEFGIITYLVYVLVFAIPGLLWLVSRILFNDDFVLKPVHFTHLVYIEILDFIYFFHHVSTRYTFLADYKDHFITYVIQALPYIIQLAFSILALREAYKDVSTDLLNPRVRFRRLFIYLIGSLLLFVTTVELASVGQPESQFFQVLFVVLIFFLAFYFSMRLVSFSNTFFLAKKPDEGEKINIDDSLVERFESLISEDKIYLESEASVHSIAKALQEPEYKVRHLINSKLKYRNFNDFLNHYRIEEAKVRLKSADFKDESILSIAYSIGYNSLAPFNKAFKLKTGQTPSEYRAAKT